MKLVTTGSLSFEAKKLEFFLQMLEFFPRALEFFFKNPEVLKIWNNFFWKKIAGLGEKIG